MISLCDQRPYRNKSPISHHKHSMLNILYIEIRDVNIHFCICKHWENKGKDSIDTKNIDERETYLERNAHWR